MFILKPLMLSTYVHYIFFIIMNHNVPLPAPTGGYWPELRQLCKTAVWRMIGAIAERYRDTRYKVPSTT